MEFQMSLDSICEGITAYSTITTKISEVTKSVQAAVTVLTTSDWSGAACDQFKVDMEQWQTQMGKYLEEFIFVNKVLVDTANAKSTEMYVVCNDFIDYII